MSTPPILDLTALPERVREALKSWRNELTDDGLLEECLLYHRACRRHATRRAANDALLEEGIATLRSFHPDGAALLNIHFFGQRRAVDHAADLHISLANFYRRLEKMINQLASVLFRLEQEARRQRHFNLETRISGVSAVPLVGVAAPLLALQTLLTDPTSLPIVSIEGIGGIGKSTLAAALLRSLENDIRIDDFGWISASPATFEFAGILRPIGSPILSAADVIRALLQQLLPEVAAQPGILPEKALALLRTHLKAAPHLIAIDNFDTVEDKEILLSLLQSLAAPTRFVLTSRHQISFQRGIQIFPVHELNEADTLAFIRQAASWQGLYEVATAGDDELRPIHATVGGNPQALLLVVGQLHFHALELVLTDLRQVHTLPVENLYQFIYRRSWQLLDEDARTLLQQLAGGSAGSTLELHSSSLTAALEQLLRLYLVMNTGNWRQARYSIHNLTRSFLQEQALRWR